MAKSGERNKARFDQRVTPSSLKEGDRVLVRNVRFRGKHKLEDKWDRDVYVVVSRLRDLPVYTVRSEISSSGPTRTLHRDLLLPCPIPPECDDPHLTSVASPSRPRTRSQKSAEANPTEDLSEEDHEWDVSRVQIQPAVFQFWSSPTESPQSSVAIDSPLLTAPAGSSPETLHERADGEPLVEPVADGVELGGCLTELGNAPTPVPEDLHVEVPVLSDLAEPSPRQIEPLIASPKEPVDAPNLRDLGDEASPAFGRPSRQRKPPDRFQYAKLGNPLISMVQTLFHGVVDAYSRTLDSLAVIDSERSRVHTV